MGFTRDEPRFYKFDVSVFNEGSFKFNADISFVSGQLSEYNDKISIVIIYSQVQANLQEAGGLFYADWRPWTVYNNQLW